MGCRTPPRRDGRGEGDLQSKTEKAIALYRGHFLEKDDEKPWTASLREKLRIKFLRAVKAQGEYWQQKAGSMKKAADRKEALKKTIDCFERGLEVDDVTEEFYQKLMLCYQQMGAKAEALKAYKRCRVALSAAFGIEPSEETENVYRSVLGRRIT